MDLHKSCPKFGARHRSEIVSCDGRHIGLLKEFLDQPGRFDSANFHLRFREQAQLAQVVLTHPASQQEVVRMLSTIAKREFHTARRKTISMALSSETGPFNAEAAVMRPEEICILQKKQAKGADGTVLQPNGKDHRLPT